MKEILQKTAELLGSIKHLDVDVSVRVCGDRGTVNDFSYDLAKKCAPDDIITYHNSLRVNPILGKDHRHVVLMTHRWTFMGYYPIHGGDLCESR